ncbi:L,D-transpeptidase family protein [Mucilaginibacter flavus]|uniref:L,D-transpeptidase family protein n=1 Tax=Mucilaginibacter flavus TaxID=931504 RepID=UPI0025B4C18B|nr:murein L,D-transpeptidase family protein [Mucilaginibacter flavus]MDN3581298.1 murein L,D-transpeptidase family protein [Mucilaginibacter flavus]
MLKLFCYLLISCFTIFSPKHDLPDSKRASDVRFSIWPKLQKELEDRGFKTNVAVYIRIFKDQNALEVWVKSGLKYKLFKTYEICYYSGNLGTKTRSGDNKSPEGFYTIEPKQLNPVSNYYLAINVGYPNKLERLKGYTGDAIMIHGHCASIGCYAMTDPRIEEIYTLVYKAFEGGQQKVNLDIYPFRMDAAHMAFYSHQPYMAFWKTLKPGYDRFEKTHIPADYHIKGKEYVF